MERMLYVTYADVIEGKQQNAVHLEVKKDGTVTLPKPDRMLHGNASFSGWKSDADGKIYNAGATVKVEKNTSFLAVWTNKKKNIKPTQEENKVIVHYRRCSDYNDSKEVVVENPTSVAKFEDIFNGKTAYTGRKFLGWVANPYDYYMGIDTKLLQPDVLFEESALKDANYIVLSAVFENPTLGIQYDAGNGIGKTPVDKQTYEYSIDENSMITLKNVEVLTGEGFTSEFSKFKYWESNYGDFIGDLRWQPGKYEQLKLPCSQVPEILYEILINGYVTLYAYCEIDGIIVKYHIDDSVIGDSPNDDHIYGDKENQCNYFVFPEPGNLEMAGYVFSKWSVYNGEYEEEYNAGDTITIDKMKTLANEYHTMWIVPSFKPVLLAIFDFSELPEDIKIDQVFDQKTTDRMIILPDIEKYFENTAYYFKGWQTSDGYFYDKIEKTIQIFDDEVFKPVVIKQKKFKIKYDCSEFDDITCPIDETEYALGDFIHLKSLKDEDIFKNDRVFMEWGYGELYFTANSLIRIPDVYANEGNDESILENTKDGFILKLKPIYSVYNEKQPAIKIMKNTEDQIFDNSGFFSKLHYETACIFEYYYYYDNPLPEREGYHLIGLSTTPDNKGDHNVFYSLWDTSVPVEEIFHEPGIHKLYAQWIKQDDINHQADLINVNFYLKQGNGKQLTASLLLPKGNITLQQLRAAMTNTNTFVKTRIGNSLMQSLCSLNLLYNGQKYSLSDFYDKSITIDENTTSFELYSMLYNAGEEEKAIKFIGNTYGTLQDETGKVYEEYYPNQSHGNYLTTIKDIPIPMPQDGFVFKGWKVIPQIDSTAPSRSADIHGILSKFNLKKEVYSMEELKSLIISEEDLYVDDLKRYSYGLSSLTIQPVFEPKKTTSATIEYYYDNIKDDDKTVTLPRQYVGDKITEYADKMLPGHHFVKVEKLPLTLVEDASQNIIKVYYEKNRTSINIRYFYDGIEDADAAYKVNDLEVGSKYTAYKDKQKEYFTFEKAIIPEQLVDDASENEIRVYYVSKKTTVKVEYYYDRQCDASATELLPDIKVGTMIQTYEDKNKKGYHFVKSENLPLIAKEDASQNIIRIYYEKDEDDMKTTAVTIRYFYDGVEDKAASYKVQDLAVGSHYANYLDKHKEQYVLVDAIIPDYLIEDADKNEILVYYEKMKEEITYTSVKIEYYYDGKLDDTKTELLEHLKVGDCVSSYPEKLKEGYHFVKTMHFPLIAKEDVSQNIIQIYYEKDQEDKKTTSVKIRYFYDGKEDIQAAYSISHLPIGAIYQNYEDKPKKGFTFLKVVIPESLSEDASLNEILVYYVSQTIDNKEDNENKVDKPKEKPSKKPQNTEQHANREDVKTNDTSYQMVWSAFFIISGSILLISKRRYKKAKK